MVKDTDKSNLMKKGFIWLTVGRCILMVGKLCGRSLLQFLSRIHSQEGMDGAAHPASSLYCGPDPTPWDVVTPVDTSINLIRITLHRYAQRSTHLDNPSQAGPEINPSR